MSTTTRNIITFAVGAIAVWIAIHWIFKIVFSIVSLLLPVALVGGALYAGYQLFGKKALGGGRRTLP